MYHLPMYLKTQFSIQQGTWLSIITVKKHARKLRSYELLEETTQIRCGRKSALILLSRVFKSMKQGICIVSHLRHHGKKVAGFPHSILVPCRQHRTEPDAEQKPMCRLSRRRKVFPGSRTLRLRRSAAPGFFG